MNNNYCLEISGDFACFTRPEMKVERVSYDVITPSAARAIFETILWKPAIRWRTTKIEVLNPIKWISVRRNEIGKIFKSRTGLFIEEERQQRAGLFLRDVRYHIYADLLFDQAKDSDSNYKKYTEMFERRVKKGQCFNQPYLGCREFACSFRLVKNPQDKPIEDSRQLGWMLYDMDYQNKKNSTPRFFNAEMKNGVIIIPKWDSKEVRR